MVDPELRQRPAHLRRAILVNLAARFWGVEIVAAPVGVEAGGQALDQEGLEKALKRRERALFLDQKGRIDLAGRIVQRHHQIKRLLIRQPGKATGVLVEHHAGARLALALAPMRAALLGPAHQPRTLEPQLQPSIAETEVRGLAQMVVEMLHIPTRIAGAVKGQHPRLLVRRHPPRRCLAEPAVHKTLQPLFLKAVAVAAELTLRYPQNLARLRHAQLPPIPTVQQIQKLRHPALLQHFCPGHRLASLAKHQTGQILRYLTRTYLVLPT